MQDRIRVTRSDPEDYPEYGYPCFLNPTYEGGPRNPAWRFARHSEGLTLKHLFIEGETKPAGFIEYVPGEYAWRAVDTPGSFSSSASGSIRRKTGRRNLDQSYWRSASKTQKFWGKSGLPRLPATALSSREKIFL